MRSSLRSSLAAAVCAVSLGTASHGAAAQAAPQAVAPAAPSPASAAAAQGAGASASAPIAATPASAAASAADDCAACVQAAKLEQFVQRMEAAASAAAGAPAGGGESAFATVFWNVFSNRIDALLFGSGEAGRGVVPVFVGVLTLVAAMVKLAMALAARKRTADRSPFAKKVDVVLAGYLVVAAGVALWALVAAKSAADAASAPALALSTALDACTAELKSARSAGVAAPAASAGTDRRLLVELQGVRAACVAAAEGQATQLAAISASTKSIASDQHGFLFNLLVVAAAFGVFALVYKAFRE